MSTDKLDKKLTDLLVVVEKTLHITILLMEDQLLLLVQFFQIQFF